MKKRLSLLFVSLVLLLAGCSKEEFAPKKDYFPSWNSCASLTAPLKGMSLTARAEAAARAASWSGMVSLSPLMSVI